jgi:hypothetical protein
VPDARGRPSAAARGYDAGHRRLRMQLAPAVAAGQEMCWRCGQLIGPREEWDLGHDDHDRSKYRGPEHVRCNRATRARLGDPRPRRAGWI